jgi:hypothetical protein
MEKKRYRKKPKHLRKIATRRWEKQNPKAHQRQIWRTRIRQLGLKRDMERILNALEKQKRCAICGCPAKRMNRTRLHIDHDHRRKRFRGLICGECNFGLGLFKDNPMRLRKAAVYLLKHLRLLQDK